MSLEEVHRATPGAGDAEDASGGGASGGSGGRASPRGGSLADTLGRVVGWSSMTAASPPRKGPGKDDDGFAHQYPFEDGILGEGLATYGGRDRPASSVAERERELERREARVALAEETLRSRELGEDASARRKNWPAFYPLVHHDLNADIPSCNRPMLRAAYAAWLLTASGYALNFATITFAMFGGAGAGVGDWFMALLFFVLGVPISFLAWYRGLYFAAQRTDRFGFWATASYGRFFLNFFAHLLVCCWMLLGLPVVGSMCAGVFFTLRRFGSKGGGLRRLRRRVGAREQPPLGRDARDQLVGRVRRAQAVQGRGRGSRAPERGRDPREREPVGVTFRIIFFKKKQSARAARGDALLSSRARSGRSDVPVV